MKNTPVREKDVKKQWVLVDASNQTLGRLASRIAILLRGKHRPNYTPHLDCGDYVVVTNAEKIKMTGNKLSEKFYYHHTGYVGGIKAISAKDLLTKFPERVLITAVKGMLHKNKLSYRMMNHLKVYKGPNHPHTAQNPTLVDLLKRKA